MYSKWSSAWGIALVTVGLSTASLKADSISWSGGTVAGEDPSQLPGGVSGSIAWTISGGNLVFALQNTTSAAQPNSGWVLTGFLFDFDASGGLSLDPSSAVASSVLDAGGQWAAAGGGADVSGQYAAGINKSAFGSTFDWAVGAVGDIDNGLSTLGNGEVIGSPLITPSPNGIDFSVISAAGRANHGSFKTGGSLVPLVQDTLTVTFAIQGGTLPDGDTTRVSGVTPYFGTDGAGLVPLPAAVWMGLTMFGAMGMIRGVRGPRRRGDER